MEDLEFRPQRGYRTRLTPRGMELHGYFNKFVPWDSIRGIQVLSYDTVDDVPVAGWSGRPVAGKADRTATWWPSASTVTTGLDCSCGCRW